MTSNCIFYLPINHQSYINLQVQNITIPEVWLRSVPEYGQDRCGDHPLGALLRGESRRRPAGGARRGALRVDHLQPAPGVGAEPGPLERLGELRLEKKTEKKPWFSRKTHRKTMKTLTICRFLYLYVGKNKVKVCKSANREV